MKRSIPAIFLLTPVLLAACTTPPHPISSAPVSVTPTGNPALRGVIGFEPTAVRSYKDRKEFDGAACNIQGIGYTAKLTTPGIVNLPDQRHNSQPVSATCSADGVTRTEVVSAFNKTSHKNANSAAGQGLFGAAVIAVYNGVRDKSNDDWGYPEIRVRFD